MQKDLSKGTSSTCKCCILMPRATPCASGSKYRLSLQLRPDVPAGSLGPSLRGTGEIGGVVFSFDIGVLCQAFHTCYHKLNQRESQVHTLAPVVSSCPVPTPTLCYHIRPSGRLQFGTVVVGSNIPGCRSDSTAVANSIDVPVCFVGPK